MYPREDISYICEKNSENNIDIIVNVPKKNKAPVTKGDKAGTLKIIINDEEYKEIDLIYEESIGKITFSDLGKKFIRNWIC